MRDRLDQFGDLAVAALTFADAARLAAHRERLHLPFPLLADPDRTLYRRFELGRGSRRQIWSPGTIRRYVRLIGQGHRLRRPTEDTRQLGGDFIVGPDGRLAAGFWPRSPDDRPTIDTLIEAVGSSRAV